jgi:hypothetical protein
MGWGHNLKFEGDLAVVMALRKGNKEGINMRKVILLKINERFIVVFMRVAGENAIIFILALDFFGIVSYIISVERKRTLDKTTKER